MDDSLNKKELEIFLKTAKKLISDDKFDFIPRRKNLMSLAEYGLSIKDVKEEILDLEDINYFKGPKEDFERPGVIWEFKTKIESDIFYVKLKIVEENKLQVLKCLSFHKSDFD